jgi:hypothetical protein
VGDLPVYIYVAVCVVCLRVFVCVYVCVCVCVCVWERETIYTQADGSAAQECVFLRKLCNKTGFDQHRPTIIYQDCKAAQRASLRHTAAGIPQGGGGVCGGGGEVAGWLG